MAENDTTRWVRDLLSRAGHKRIQEPLGDASAIKPGMTPRERLLARRATMTDAEKMESLARITDLVEDTCDYCGGSLSEFDHDEDCQDPDQIEWRRIKGMSSEELDAELREAGLDPEKSRAKFRAMLDDLQAKAEARIKDGGSEG
jgi:hypothetical protein